MNVLKTAAMTVRHGGMRNRVSRARHTAGLVLAIVGLISAALTNGPIPLASAQTVAGSWSYTGSLNTARSSHSASLLRDGKVLVVGYSDGSAELYDPSTGTWSLTASLNVPRAYYTATLLADGKVLVAGGKEPLGVGAIRAISTHPAIFTRQRYCLMGRCLWQEVATLPASSIMPSCTIRTQDVEHYRQP